MITNNAPQNSIGHILFQYDLYPEKIEQFGKVKKIVTSRGTYALKESSMTRDQAHWFSHVMKRLDKLNFKQLVPLIPTKYGDLTITHGNKTYYLQPWFLEDAQIPDEKKEKILFKQLGKLHGLTVKHQEFSQETIETSYQDLLNRWEKRRIEMEYFAEEAERKTYMSPFELTFLTHYSRLDMMANTATKYLKAWHDECLEKKSFRAVLCHGKLDRNHIYYHPNGYGYLFNFEKAVLDTPARDLAISFRKSFQYTLWSEDQGAEWLEAYQKFILLEDEEKKLFASYLIYPEPIFHCLDLYKKRDGTITELQFVQLLEKRIITMTRVNYFIHKTLLKNESSQPSE
ncbi:spore coat protein YsxE [Anaerobacillus isosaccharinicus]|uniref:Spore coat protein YsxE n=1 Tax=Anaerobacillus isosaccharinicus TaxID=1532552 RepID=A0A1S2MEF9_9BACI|nr:spore coat protein YsxE [Anaerobacillus isosaccharinicus]MBA5587836.1 spore coat protein YsxE [Anaerobacillus isosaccharinicus]QOY34010.1 spore coat protein YsxE [Anaerobacillus isosaccharinicus]